MTCNFSLRFFTFIAERDLAGRGHLPARAHGPSERARLVILFMFPFTGRSFKFNGAKSISGVVWRRHNIATGDAAELALAEWKGTYRGHIKDEWIMEY